MTDPAVVDPEAPVDGRTLRAARTRTAIVDALLSLIDEGDLQPTAGRIAERAGISLRLIYHHFGDLESLFRAAANREAERLAGLGEPIDPALPLAARIDSMVEQRARQLEMIAPVRRASLLQEPFSDELRVARDAFYAIGEQLVLEVFGGDIDALPAERRPAVRDALPTVLAWGTWNDLRQTGRSVDQAAAAVRETLTALLRP